MQVCRNKEVFVSRKTKRFIVTCQGRFMDSAALSRAYGQIWRESCSAGIKISRYNIYSWKMFIIFYTNTFSFFFLNQHGLIHFVHTCKHMYDHTHTLTHSQKSYLHSICTFFQIKNKHTEKTYCISSRKNRMDERVNSCYLFCSPRF